jgi:hypothetical protein
MLCRELADRLAGIRPTALDVAKLGAMYGIDLEKELAARVGRNAARRFRHSRRQTADHLAGIHPTSLVPTADFATAQKGLDFRGAPSSFKSIV